MTGFQYQFPKNKRAAENTLNQQLLKVIEEMLEVIAEYMKDPLDDRKIIGEIMDLYASTEGLLRKYPNLVEKGYEDTLAKWKERSDI